jgi:hypothetical protein
MREFGFDVTDNVVIFPREQDVLCGSGRIPAKHPGNIVFRDIVAKYFHALNYGKLVDRKHKTMVSMAIYMEITILLQARFLKKHPQCDNLWIVCSERAGRDKISHFLRDMTDLTSGNKKPRWSNMALFATKNHQEQVTSSVSVSKDALKDCEPLVFDLTCHLDNSLDIHCNGDVPNKLVSSREQVEDQSDEMLLDVKAWQSPEQANEFENQFNELLTIIIQSEEKDDQHEGVHATCPS